MGQASAHILQPTQAFSSLSKAAVAMSRGKSAGLEISRHPKGQMSTQIPQDEHILLMTTGLGHSLFFTRTAGAPRPSSTAPSFGQIRPQTPHSMHLSALM